MRRRSFLTAVGASVTLSLSGCLGGPSDEQLAEDAAEVIDDELGLAPVGEDDPGWTIAEEENEWLVEYYTSYDRRFDFQVVGGAYAGIVDDGFSLDAVLLGADPEVGGSEGYVAEIRRDWAEAYSGDEITEDEYLRRIENTML